MPCASNFFSTASALVFLASSAALASAFAFFASRDAASFFGLPQSSLLFFQVSLQSVNVGGDGYNLSIQKRNSLLLLRDLGCVVGIGFGTVFASFRSGHR